MGLLSKGSGSPSRRARRAARPPLAPFCERAAAALEKGGFEEEKYFNRICGITHLSSSLQSARVAAPRAVVPCAPASKCLRVSKRCSSLPAAKETRARSKPKRGSFIPDVDDTQSGAMVVFKPGPLRRKTGDLSRTSREALLSAMMPLACASLHRQTSLNTHWAYFCSRLSSIRVGVAQLWEYKTRKKRARTF